MNEQCGNCRFWKKYMNYDNGYCRRFPPHGKFSHTTTSETDWCGEWVENPKMREQLGEDHAEGTTPAG